MSTATKPFDRRKPFRRVDNQAFIPSKVLDGDGAASGCRLQRDLGDIDAKLDAFLKDSRNEVIGKTLGDVLDFVRLLLSPNKLADMLLDFIRQEAGEVAAAVLTVPIKVAGGVLAFLLSPVTKVINAIISAVEGGLRIFLRIFAKPLMLRANRVIPQWVPVTPGASSTLVDRSQVIEVEGICTRSYGNPVDVPLANWHTWFAWNVQVTLEREYELARSPSGDPPNTSGAQAGETSVIRPGTFEIQWDVGALMADQGNYRRGFPSGQMPANDGPMVLGGRLGTALDPGENNFNLAFVWPMPGMFVWASGRHVYDCSRVTHKAGADPAQDAEADAPLMAAMMQPARAMATARFQAFQFRENNNFFVPAIEFMFIACRRGGYIEHDALADEDYVFIIDLPPGPAPATPFPVAHTDDVPHNTITLRPRLLKQLRFLQPIGSPTTEPVLELLPPPQPGQAPQQVRLTVPKGVLDGVAAYGFKLALGWHDPSQELARQVLLCELEIKTLQMRLTDREKPAQKLRNLGKEQENVIRDAVIKELEGVEIDLPLVGRVQPMKIKPLRDLVASIVGFALEKLIDVLIGMLPSEAEEEWLFRIGMNGAWVSFFFQPKTSGTNVATNPPLVFNANELLIRFALAKGDELMFASHGTEFDPVGDIMHSAIDKRTLKLDNQPVPWSTIVRPASEPQRDQLLFAYMRKLMFDTTEGVSKLALGFDNSPLGLVDPQDATRGVSQQSNPMVAQETFDPALRAQRLGHFARAIPPEMVLVESLADDPRFGFPRRPDYDLRYELKVKPQIADAPPPDA